MCLRHIVTKEYPKINNHALAFYNETNLEMTTWTNQSATALTGPFPSDCLRNCEATLVSLILNLSLLL